MPSFLRTLHNPPPESILLHENRSAINPSDVRPETLARLTRLASTLPTRDRCTLHLVDGFLLYDDPAIIASYDVRLFLSASFEALRDRRAARKGYVTLEGFWKDPPNYFEEFVWPAYERYNARILGAIKREGGDGAEEVVLREEDMKVDPEEVGKPGRNYVIKEEGNAPSKPVKDDATAGRGVYVLDSAKIGVEEMVVASVEYIVSRVQAIMEDSAAAP
ncbi:ribosylnicotinamide kinase [Irineochytrium annulatum]|nr:ribosylnicotinamide kinase [Irineochytrium annulatum]